MTPNELENDWKPKSHFENGRYRVWIIEDNSKLLKTLIVYWLILNVNQQFVKIGCTVT